MPNRFQNIGAKQSNIINKAQYADVYRFRLSRSPDAKKRDKSTPPKKITQSSKYSAKIDRRKENMARDSDGCQPKNKKNSKSKASVPLSCHTHTLRTSLQSNLEVQKKKGLPLSDSQNKKPGIIWEGQECKKKIQIESQAPSLAIGRNHRKIIYAKIKSSSGNRNIYN